jgi:hypothetical protein
MRGDVSAYGSLGVRRAMGRWVRMDQGEATAERSSCVVTAQRATMPRSGVRCVGMGGGR